MDARLALNMKPTPFREKLLEVMNKPLDDPNVEAQLHAMLVSASKDFENKERFATLHPDNKDEPGVLKRKRGRPRKNSVENNVMPQSSQNN
jgi:hypothetical protein